MFDESSPCGAVHTRHKNETGVRAARAFLKMAYGRSVSWSGPLPASIQAISPHLVAIDFTPAHGIAFVAVPGQTTQNHTNFEVTLDPELKVGWASSTATLNNGTSRVLVNATGGGGAIAGVRYAWPSVPHGALLFDGEGLPAPPFLARCGAAVEAGGCELVEGGAVPTNTDE